MDQKEVTLFSLSLYYFGESMSEEKAWTGLGPKTVKWNILHFILLTFTNPSKGYK